MKKKHIDYLLLISVVLISIFGIIMIFSASSIWAEFKFHDAFKYVKHQALFFFVGLIIMNIAMKINLEFLGENIIKFVFILCFIYLGIGVYKKVKNNIEITIEDTGIGISKEDQEFIFKRFSQVDGTKAIKTSSSGIGLTLVKYIVELHGGYIKLESELNVGSRFTIGIPDTVDIIDDKNESVASNL